MAEGRVVVTEDVTTFRVAIGLLGTHLGVVYCHHARLPRTSAGLARLRRGLNVRAEDPPTGLGRQPVEWWLAAPPR